MLLNKFCTLLLIFGYCSSADLPIFKNNDLIGFIKLKEIGNNVNVDFQIKENDLKFSIIDAAVPFSSNINLCEKLQKNSTIIRPESNLSKFEAPKEEIIGSTIVLTKDGNTIACTTVILQSTPLFEAIISNAEMNSHFYLFDLNETAKIISFISVAEDNSDLFIDLVEDCLIESKSNYSLTSLPTIVDIQNSTLLGNLQNSFLKLFNEKEVISCKKFAAATHLSANAMDVYVEQKNAFVAPKLIKNFKSFSIGETCNQTTDKVIIRNNYAPDLILFGRESKIFKALRLEEKCDILLPKFGFPILTSSLLHPIIGKVHLIQTSINYYVVSDLRSLFDADSTTATLSFSKIPLLSSSCFNFSSAYKVKDSTTPVRGNTFRNSINNIQSLSSRFIDFDSIKSIEVDLGWIKACANLTLLPSGAIKGNAILRTHNIAASRHLTDIEILEYPLLNETEIIASLSDSKEAKNLFFYKRPIDMTLSTSPPCSETTIGAKTSLAWEKKLKEKLGSSNGERLFLKSKALTGSKSIIGLTIMADFNDNAVGCGSIEFHGKKKTALALFNDTLIGFIKMTQISSPLALPTEVSYYLENTEHDETLQRSNHENIPKLFWEIVAMNGGICQAARPYDPYKVLDHNKCQEDIDFCPVGEVVNRSDLLILNSRQHFLLHGHSIVDGSAAQNLYVRLHTPQNHSLCSKINLYEPMFFHWISESNASLASLQEELSQRLSLSAFQIAVDYTRAFKGNRCSIFTIMLLLTPEEKDEFHKLFDIQNQKFLDEEVINCSISNDAEILSSSSSSHALSFTILFYHVFPFLLYFYTFLV